MFCRFVLVIPLCLDWLFGWLLDEWMNREIDSGTAVFLLLIIILILCLLLLFYSTSPCLPWYSFNYLLNYRISSFNQLMMFSSVFIFDDDFIIYGSHRTIDICFYRYRIELEQTDCSNLTISSILMFC